MSLTLFETFRQIDPYVKFTDGQGSYTAGQLASIVDPADPTEYVLTTDGMGRLLIYRLDILGKAISPAVYAEEKIDAPAGTLAAILPKRPDFGPLMQGFI